MGVVIYDNVGVCPGNKTLATQMVLHDTTIENCLHLTRFFRGPGILGSRTTYSQTGTGYNRCPK